jgi:hypothetical protein
LDGAANLNAMSVKGSETKKIHPLPVLPSAFLASHQLPSFLRISRISPFEKDNSSGSSAESERLHLDMELYDVNEGYTQAYSALALTVKLSVCCDSFRVGEAAPAPTFATPVAISGELELSSAGLPTTYATFINPQVSLVRGTYRSVSPNASLA